MANNIEQRSDHSTGDGQRRLRRDQLQSPCDHCKKLGHTIDQCFELIGYPANWKSNSYCDHCKKYGHTTDGCFELFGYAANWRRNSGSDTGVSIDEHRFNPTVSQMQAKEDERKTTIFHNQTWDALGLDTLQKIFDLLPSNELVWNIPLVCRSWRLVCWDKLFWGKDDCCLDLTPAAPFPSCTDDGYDQDLSIILGTIFYGNYDDSDAYGNSLRKWRNSINCIRFPIGLERHHKLLKNLSDWIPNVVSLELVGSGASKISQKGFRMVARRYCFKSLAKIHLGELSYPNSNYAAFFNAFSEKKGRRFEELHITQREFSLTKKQAYKMIPGVHSFQKVFFIEAHLYEAGLWRLLRPVRDNPWLFRRFEFHKCVFMDFDRSPNYYLKPSASCFYYPFSKLFDPPDIHYSPSKLYFERSEGLYKWWIIDDDED